MITAGSKGLGRKVTEALLEKGYSVTVNYRQDEEAVNRLKMQFSQHLDRLQFIKGDATQKDDMRRLVHEAITKFGRVDFLINNAGPYIFHRKKLADYTDEEWYEMMEGNLSAVFHLFKAAIPFMRKQRFGRIITYGFQGAGHASGWLHRSAYGAAKSGLVSLTKSIAIEEAEAGITANMVCPGDIIGEMKEATIQYARSVEENKTPIGRSGTGQDIARIIAFLCEENSDLITGAVIEAAGGLDVLRASSFSRK